MRALPTNLPMKSKSSRWSAWMTDFGLGKYVEPVDAFKNKARSSLNICLLKRVNHSLVRPPSSTPASFWNDMRSGALHSSAFYLLIKANESSKAYSRLTRMSHVLYFYFAFVFLSMMRHIRRFVSNSRICGILTTRFLSCTLITC